MNRIGSYDPKVPIRYFGARMDSKEKLEYDEYKKRVNLLDAQRANELAKLASNTGAANFKKGIKRNKDDYHVFRDEVRWDAWWREFKAQAKTHDLVEITDVNGKRPPASDAAATELYEQKKQFMYAVLVRILQTDKGQSLVRTHETDSDAHQIIKELYVHHTSSAVAQHRSTKLLERITSAKWGSTRTNKALRGWILSWLDNVREYNSIVGAGNQLPEHMLRTHLETALRGVPEIAGINTMENLQIAGGGSKFSYNDYKENVLVIADAIDNKNVENVSNRMGRLRINQHDLDPLGFQVNRHDQLHEDEDYYATQANLHAWDSEESYDHDEEVDDIQVNEGSTSRYGPSVSAPVFRSLTPEGQRLWNSFTPEDKTKIDAFYKQKYASSSTRSSGSSQPSQQSYNSPMRGSPQRSSQRPGSGTPPLARGGFGRGGRGGLGGRMLPSNSSTPTRRAYEAQATSGGSPDQGTIDVNVMDLSSPGAIEDDQGPVLYDVNVTSTGTATNTNDFDFSLEAFLASNDSLNKKESKSGNGRNKKTSFPKIGKIKVNANVTYNVSNHQSSKKGSLVDRGANGGVAGDDCRIMQVDAIPRRVNVSGLADSQLSGVPIGTVGAYMHTNKGPIIAIWHQVALYGKGNSIHASAQMEHYKIDVNERSMNTKGGLQRITTLEGYVIPIDIMNGLPYIRQRPYTDEEYDSLPHIVMTSDVEWDPSVLDNVISDKEDWYANIEKMELGQLKYPFDEFGNYKKRELVEHENYKTEIESLKKEEDQPSGQRRNDPRASEFTRRGHDHRR